VAGIPNDGIGFLDRVDVGDGEAVDSRDLLAFEPNESSSDLLAIFPNVAAGVLPDPAPLVSENEGTGGLAVLSFPNEKPGVGAGGFPKLAVVALNLNFGGSELGDGAAEAPGFDPNDNCGAAGAGAGVPKLIPVAGAAVGLPKETLLAAGVDDPKDMPLAAGFAAELLDDPKVKLLAEGAALLPEDAAEAAGPAAPGLGVSHARHLTAEAGFPA